MESKADLPHPSTDGAESSPSEQTPLIHTPSLPVFVPEGPNEVWSADFMSDALYHGSRFRPFNIIDDCNREALAIEINPSLLAERVIRVLDRLKPERELPHMIRVDNVPGFIAQAL